MKSKFTFINTIKTVYNLSGGGTFKQKFDGRAKKLSSYQKHNFLILSLQSNLNIEYFRFKSEFVRKKQLH